MLMIGSIAIIAGIALDTALLTNFHDFLHELGYYDNYPAFVASMASVIALWGTTSLAAGLGLLKRKSWARRITIILLFIEIAIGISFLINETHTENIIETNTGNIIENAILIIVSGLILSYLYRPHVRAYFSMPF